MVKLSIGNRGKGDVERGTPLNNSIGTGMLVQSELACNPENRGKIGVAFRYPFRFAKSRENEQYFLNSPNRDRLKLFTLSPGNYHLLL